VVPLLSEAPVFVLRKPAMRVFRLDGYVAAGMLTAEWPAACPPYRS
jgi:hypothetical protein